MRCRYLDLGSVSNWPKLISLAIRQIGSNSQLWVVTLVSTEFLRSFLRRHFVGKPVVALQNVSCFLSLTALR